MFLDTFIENSSECIDLVDLELECAVSLEAAYNDMMLETCQLKYQELTEGVSVINEGVIESIKNFFKKLFNAIKKFFGFSSSSGGGASPSNIDKLKKKVINNSEKIKAGMKYIMEHPELNDKYKIVSMDTFFPEDINIESYLKAAMENTEKSIEKFKKELESSNDIDANGDKIALDALRIFTNKMAMENHLVVSKEINSLDDFKKMLYNQIIYITIKDYYANKDIDEDFVDIVNCGGVNNMLDDLKEKVRNSSNYRARIEKQMKLFEDKIISQANERYPQFVNIALKSANILTRACIIGAVYLHEVWNEIYRTTLALVVAAGKIHINE